MGIEYINTGTSLGSLPKIKRDVSPDFAKSPTAIFEYLLRNLRGMERVFDGVTTQAARMYPEVYVIAPDQYVTKELAPELAENKRNVSSPAIDVALLSRILSTRNAQPPSKGEGNSNSRNNYQAYNQLYKLYRQVFELYNRISGNARSRANQVYNSTAEVFKRLGQGIYKKDIGEKAQGGHSPSFRKKFSWDLGRVLEYLRTHGSAYLRDIKKRHLPSHDIGIKGLEGLLQES